MRGEGGEAEAVFGVLENVEDVGLCVGGVDVGDVGGGGGEDVSCCYCCCRRLLASAAVCLIIIIIILIDSECVEFLVQAHGRMRRRSRRFAGHGAAWFSFGNGAGWHDGCGRCSAHG